MAPLTTQSRSLRCVSAAEHHTAEQYSKMGRTKPLKHLPRISLSWNTFQDCNILWTVMLRTVTLHWQSAWQRGKHSPLAGCLGRGQSIAFTYGTVNFIMGPKKTPRKIKQATRHQTPSKYRDLQIRCWQQEGRIMYNNALHWNVWKERPWN